MRLRHVLRERDVRGRADEQVLSVYRDLGVVPKAGRTDNFNKTPEDVSNYKLVCSGDVVVNKMKAWQGSIAVSGHQGIVSGDYLVCEVVREVDKRFLHHALRSRRMVGEYVLRSKGIRPSQWRLYWDDLAGIDVRLPALDEQRAIADFLDAETARIDALITKKRRLIDLLEERANARILALIGRSALAGFEEVEVAPIRRQLQKQERWAADGEMVTAFRDGEVTTRVARGREGFTNAWTEGSRVQSVEIGDVVVHGLDGFSGAIGDAQLAGVCSPVYHVCTPIDGDGAFLGRMLRLLALDGYLGNFATSTRERAVDFRNWDLFGRIPIPVVSADLQREVGNQIRAIRPLRAKILESEELAREHRQALITAAVTGDLEVPGVAA